MSVPLAPIELFYSYADANEEFRSELDRHLIPICVQSYQSQERLAVAACLPRLLAPPPVPYCPFERKLA
jgi:hypothetical protein